MKKQQFYATLTFMLITTLIAIGAALWALSAKLPPWALRLWLITSPTIIMPLLAYTCWQLGARDARAYIAGVDKGTDRVMTVAGQTADLRTANVGQMRQPAWHSARPAISLPRPDITHVQARNGEIVDL